MTDRKLARPDQMLPGEAAARLGVSVPTLHAWAARGRIGYWRTLGGHRRFDRAEVELLRAVMRGTADNGGSGPAPVLPSSCRLQQPPAQPSHAFGEGGFAGPGKNEARPPAAPAGPLHDHPCAGKAAGSKIAGQTRGQ